MRPISYVPAAFYHGGKFSLLHFKHNIVWQEINVCVKNEGRWGPVVETLKAVLVWTKHTDNLLLTSL